MRPKRDIGLVRPRVDRWQMEANRLRALGELAKARWLEALIADVRKR